jgi:hypothetical protein
MSGGMSVRTMPDMSFSSGAGPDGDDLTPWERAAISIELWERAVDVATVDYEAIVRRLAEIYEQRNVAAWRDARTLTSLARSRVAAVLRGDADTIGRVLRGRRSWAG